MVTAALAGVLFLSAAAGRDPTAAEARKYFQWGERLFKKAEYEEAIAKFEEAYRIKPHPVIFFNIAKCYEQLGAHAKALRNYREYLRLLPDAKDRETVSEAIGAIERRLKTQGVQQVLLFADPPGARVEVDGQDLGLAPVSAELKPGNHRLVLRRDGYETVERSFVMSHERSLELSVTLKPLPEPAPTPPLPPPPLVVAPPREDAPLVPAARPGSVTEGGKPVAAPAAPALAEIVSRPVASPRGRTWVYVAGAGAGVAVASGIGFGLMANKASRELLAERHPRAEAQRLAEQANTFGTVANVSYGAAAASGILAAILLFAGAPPVEPATGSASSALPVGFTF